MPRTPHQIVVTTMTFPSHLQNALNGSLYPPLKTIDLICATEKEEIGFSCIYAVILGKEVRKNPIWGMTVRTFTNLSFSKFFLVDGIFFLHTMLENVNKLSDKTNEVIMTSW